MRASGQSFFRTPGKMTMPGTRFVGVRGRWRPPATPTLALVLLVATLSDVVCDERDVARGRGESGGVKQRDCSHLSGRQLKDCDCRGALERTQEAWGRGDVSGAGRAAMDCDASSPGLVAKDKALLRAVRCSLCPTRADHRLTPAARCARGGEVGKGSERSRLVAAPLSRANLDTVGLPASVLLCRALRMKTVV